MTMEVLFIVATGVLVGVMSALFGVGGGIIMVPFMVLFLDETQHVAEGTSLLVIVPTAIAGVIAHRKTGYVSLRNLILLGVAGAGGAVVGARVALAIDPSVLRDLFAVLVMIVGVRLILQGLRSEQKTASA